MRNVKWGTKSQSVKIIISALNVYYLRFAHGIGSSDSEHHELVQFVLAVWPRHGIPVTYIYSLAQC